MNGGKEAPLVHGWMVYSCPSCGRMWNMWLEIGVEDHGRNGRPHQPCPFCMRCECGELAEDVSGYKSLGGALVRLPGGCRYFAYDHSGRADACGMPSVWHGEDDAERGSVPVETMKEALAAALAGVEDLVSDVLDDIDPEIKELVRRRHEDQGNGLAGVIPPKKLPGMEARAAQGRTQQKRRHGREKGRKL